jgi:hypothetical protein
MMMLAVLCAAGWELEPAMALIETRPPVVDFADEHRLRAGRSIRIELGGSMRKGRRSVERLFCGLLLALIVAMGWTPGLWAAGPSLTTISEVSYRGRDHARGRVTNGAGIAALRRGADDGVRGGVRQIAIPLPRTSADCETAALALLDDAGQGWAGQYQAWSPFLPGGAEDIFPGDGLAIDVPSRGMSLAAIVQDVEVEIADLAGENSRYTLKFVDAGDPSLDFAFQTATVRQATALAATDVSMIGQVFLPDLTDAAVTTVTSTTVTVDAGFTPGTGEGIEVRSSDAGWGPDNDRNLVGRFPSNSFTLARFARAQDYFLRRYDSSSPPKYSRHSAGLHVDYPL